MHSVSSASDHRSVRADKTPAYLRGIRELIVLAFFLVFLGVVYQVSDRQASMSGTTADAVKLPGSMASERATGLTSHLDAMGCRKSARVMSVP